MKNNPKDPYFKHFVEDIEQRYHIRVLLVDDYKDIQIILNELNSRIRSKRVFVSGAFSSFTSKSKNIRIIYHEIWHHHFLKMITG